MNGRKQDHSYRALLVRHERRARARRVRGGLVAGVLALAVGVPLAVVATRLSHHPAGTFNAGPAFSGASPTGRVAYMRLTKPLTERDSSDLFVVDAASGRVAPVHEGTGFSVWPQWSPDGSLIAYASNETAEGGIGIFVADAGGRDPVNILDREGILEDGGPISVSWSPKGSRIAYVGRHLRSGRSGVWVVNADGTGNHEVLAGHWESVSWSRDGELLLGGDPTTGPGAGQFDIYTVGLDGSGLTRLTDDEAIERQPRWSPDGSRIVFAKVTVEAENHDYGQDVFVMDPDGSKVRRLTDWEGFDSFAVWSPEGEWIAFASDRDATPEQLQGNSGDRPLSGVSIYVMRPDGSDVHRLAEGGDVALLPSSWTY